MYSILEPVSKASALLSRKSGSSANQDSSSSDGENVSQMREDNVIIKTPTSAPSWGSLHPARRVLIQRQCDVPRSVSFDERTEMHPVTRPSTSSLEHICETGSVGSLDSRSGLPMDKISTMTLTEFKSLLNSSLSLPDSNHHVPEANTPNHSHGLDADPNQRANWDSLREKARSVRDALSSRVNARRAGNINGRSSLPQSPDEDKRFPGAERPKTPQSQRRNVSSSVVSRPKTPTGGCFRPQTPTSSEKSLGKEEYKMSRPKTPSQVKRDAVAKAAGAISNWVESRTEMDLPVSRPKTPTRSKTPVGFRGGYDSADDEQNSDMNSSLSKAQLLNLAASLKERPSTPSRIPKPCFVSRPNTPKNPFSDASSDDLSTQSTTSQISRPSSIMASRPGLVTRSNSNSSSIRSEDTPSSPVSSYSEDTNSFKVPATIPRPTTIISRKQQAVNSSINSSNNNGNSYKDIYHARRAYTPGPGSSGCQAITPGPREKWGTSSNGGGAGQARRGSLDTCWAEKDQFKSQQHMSTLTISGPDQTMTITNEITFSDDEEINELVRNVAFMAHASNKRIRSSSVDARKLASKNSKISDGENLTTQRDSSDPHGVKTSSKANIMRRPPYTDSAGTRSRSQTPDSSTYRQKANTTKVKPAGNENGEKHINRTEAWVDSTLSDPKRKLSPRSKRSKGVVNEIPASELEPRPLEEIKAILTEPKNGFVQFDTETLEPLPEDPEMFRKMEKLFEKFKERELRASINNTPGGSMGPQLGDKNSDAKYNKGSRTSPSLASVKTSSGSGVSSSGFSSGHANGANSAKSSSTEDNRFRRSSSVPGSFQNVQKSGGHSSTLLHFQEGKDPLKTMDAYDNSMHSESCGHTTVLEADSVQNSWQDIDAEMAKNPNALVSKIKEILKVRPRRDENSEIPTRIPGPASLTKSSRSKSVTNLYGNKSYNSDGDCSREDGQDNYGLAYPNKDSKDSSPGPLVRTNNTSSGNIAYSEYVFGNDENDEVPELSHTWSVKSDSSDSQNRSETPVPKLSTPLTTGRSTLLGRKLGQGASQDKDYLSNSQSSLSNRSALSATEDEADFV